MFTSIYLILTFTILRLHSQKLEEILNVNDILNAELMPSSVIMLDKESKPNNVSVVNSNGSWHEAFTTMGFHRKMFNEYLCRSFVADNILNQINTPVITKRIGRPFQTKDDYPSASKRKSRAELADVKNDLLSDPGSSNYKDWLTKTTTLEDIYRHYEADNPISRTSDDDEDEYEGGEITGYAMPRPPYNYMSSYDSHGPYVAQGVAADDDSDKHGGEYDYFPHHVHYHHTEESTEKAGHGLSLPDIFDVSLTGLAFLSFGIFILQVIMCISMNKNPQVMQMVEEPGTETLDEIRFKRDVSDGRTSLNDLAKRILLSIETGLYAENDDGVCMRRVLCENNKYSRTLKDNQKLWIPIWGLGMSWLSGRLISNKPSATTMLESLGSCAMGLGNAECSTLYSDCDLKQFLIENRRSNKGDLG